MLDNPTIPTPKILSATPPLLKTSLASLIPVVLVAVAFLSIYQQGPPGAGTTSTSQIEFSSARAMTFVEGIGKDPHPSGSFEHTIVRDFLVKELSGMGLSPEVQKTTSVNEARSIPFPAGTVENIIGRLKGSENSKPILLVAHYDSVPTGPGASDDGASVAALLETLRALKAGAPLKNDIVFLFTDAEEPGLLGAKAFVEEHPWAKEGGLVLNFEARGTSGASVMFETSSGNGWLIKEFTKAAPHPVSSSFLYEIYKVLPNDTDFTIFKKAGFAGLNFAYINDVTSYHTRLDTIANVNEQSLQHQGSYALALTRHFGNLDLRDIKQSDAVYFNTIFGFVRYPGTWAKPLAIFVVFLFFGVVILGFKTKQLSFFGIVFGFLILFLSMIVAVFVGIGVWLLLREFHSGYKSVSLVEPYNSSLYMISFVALAIALTSTIYVLFRKTKIRTMNLTFGGLFWWFTLMVLTAFLLPGASFLFTWPLISSLLALAYIFVSKEESRVTVNRFAVLSLSAIPGIMFFAPLVYLLFHALTINAVAIDMLAIVLLLGSLIPHLNLISTRDKWLLPGAMAVICLGFIVAASITAGFDQSHPKPNNLSYALNANSGKAAWVSSDARLDEYTSQFIKANSEKLDMADYLPLKPVFWNSKKFLNSEADPIELAAPNVVLLEDKNTDGVRMIRMRINSSRRAPVISVSLGHGTEVLQAVINGKHVQNGPTRTPAELKNGWGFTYYALPEDGIELVIQSRSTGPLDVKVVDESYGVPEIPGRAPQPRPANTMPSAFPYSSSTLVGKSFTF
jgi:hypothetical protein